VRDVKRFQQQLIDAGVAGDRIKLVITPCAVHNESAWANRLPAALTFLFAAPPAEAGQPSPAVALRAALQQTLRGPSNPHPGKLSWFSAATSNALRSVSVDSAGHAIVDFEDLRALIPNASSSAGSAILLEELNAAVFGVDGIQSVSYLIEGSCEKFWEWLQYGCQTIRRP
jgi:hypothetical protein